MSSPHAQPDPPGSFSKQNVPPVIVRAEKYFVCSPCGVLVEIPADVVGKLVYAVKSSQSMEPPQNETTRDLPGSGDASDEATGVVGSTQRTPQATQARAADSPPRTGTQKKRPPQPNRPQPLQHVDYVGTTIDGLKVPSGKELDLAIKWVSYHLKMLDRQEGEIKHLKKLLKKRTSPSAPCPRRHAKSAAIQTQTEHAHCAKPGHAQADLDAAPVTDRAQMHNTTERGPP